KDRASPATTITQGAKTWRSRCRYRLEAQRQNRQRRLGRYLCEREPRETNRSPRLCEPVSGGPKATFHGKGFWPAETARRKSGRSDRRSSLGSAVFALIAHMSRK